MSDLLHQLGDHERVILWVESAQQAVNADLGVDEVALYLTGITRASPVILKGKQPEEGKSNVCHGLVRRRKRNIVNTLYHRNGEKTTAAYASGQVVAGAAVVVGVRCRLAPRVALCDYFKLTVAIHVWPDHFGYRVALGCGLVKAPDDALPDLAGRIARFFGALWSGILEGGMVRLRNRPGFYFRPLSG